MGELKHNVGQLMRAMIGDPANPRDRPGVVHELSVLEDEVKHANRTLEELRDELRMGRLDFGRSMKRMMRFVVGTIAVAAALLIFHLKN